MRYPLLATQLYGQPLLLDPEKAAVIESVFRAYAGGKMPEASGEAAPVPMAAAYASPRFADKPYVVTEAGVAVIPVIGTLVHRGSQMDAMSGLASYTLLESQIDAAASDADVRGILLEIDSRGGQADGAFALGEKIRAVEKPVRASVNETALSGGYLIAAAADSITVTQTGRVGSIGVIVLHRDQSGANSKAGVSYTAIYAGAKKNDGTPHAPLTGSALADTQEMVYALRDHFVDYVATMRGMDAQDVRDTEAGIFSGKSAVNIGLADAVMSFNDSLAEFEAQVSKPAGFTNGGSRQLPKGVMTMSNEAQAAATLSADQLAAQAAEARGAGATEMQARIRDIQTCDQAKGREQLASHLAFNTSMGVEEAKGILAAAPQAGAQTAANPLAAGMAAVTNPAVGTDVSTQSADPQAASTGLWERSNQKLHCVK
jgi:signal peptide peptidase SppA